VRQGGHEFLGVKDGLFLEHEIDGPGDFDGQDGCLALNLLPFILGFEPLGQRPDDMVIPFGNDGCFAKGPAQVGVAQFGAAQALDLAGAGHGAFDQPTVGEEVFDGGEAVDVTDFVEDGHAQVFADARSGLDNGIVAAGGFLGKSVELFPDGG